MAVTTCARASIRFALDAQHVEACSRRRAQRGVAGQIERRYAEARSEDSADLGQAFGGYHGDDHAGEAGNDLPFSFLARQFRRLDCVFRAAISSTKRRGGKMGTVSRELPRSNTPMDRGS